MNGMWSSLIDTAGWTLVHFVWQGSLAAVVLACGLALVPRGWARVRYVLACLALASMALLPAVTASYLTQHPGDRQALTVPGRDRGGAPAANAAGKSSRTSSVASEAAAPVLRVIVPTPPTTWFPWLVGVWIAGVCVCSVRLAGGWWHTRRLAVEDAFAADDAWVRAVDQLSTRLRLRTPVRLLESARVQVPVVIGTFKPVLLLPASAMTGLSPQQIEAVLAHELAHIRRYDYLVNLVQSSVETVLFYHPAVWWVSHTIRVEREHCCDDLAVSVCGDPVLYARALTNIEMLRRDRVGIAMAVSGGSLLSRVRRLLGVRPPARFAASGWVVLSLTAILVASAGLAGWLGSAMKALPAFADAAEAATLPLQSGDVQASAPAQPASPAAPAKHAPSTRGDAPAHDSSDKADDRRAEPEFEAAVREMQDALTRKLADAQREMEAAVRSAAARLDSERGREAAMRDLERAVQHAMEQAQREVERAARMSLDSRSRQEIRGQVDAAVEDLHAHRGELEKQARELAAQVMAVQRDALTTHRDELNALSKEQARAMRESARAMARQARELAEQLRSFTADRARSWRTERFMEPPPAPPAPPAPGAPPVPPVPPPDVQSSDVPPPDVPQPPTPPADVPQPPASPTHVPPPPASPKHVPVPPAPPPPEH